MDSTDIAIIGAGVVGLAVAGEIASRFPHRSIILLERHDKFGQETSSRNSEVIHAGIYYPEGSLKAELCVRGKKLLYDFCTKWDVPHRRLGKLIVAVSEEGARTLESLLQKGLKNGVTDLEMLDRRETMRLEPNISAHAAILSPSTGIIDSHRLMERLEQQAIQAGVVCAYRHDVTGIAHNDSTYTMHYNGPNNCRGDLRCRWLINCAGLSADAIAGYAGIDTATAEYRLHPCKGEYFRLSASKSKLVNRLIYPPPYTDLRGLGIHITKLMDGTVKLGPNAFYTDNIDYSVDETHVHEFYEGAKKFLPFLQPDDLQPDTAGIRPKLQAPGIPIRDFIIRHEADRGLQGFINLIGIESPGLTACLSIAEMTGDILKGCAC